MRDRDATIYSTQMNIKKFSLVDYVSILVGLISLTLLAFSFHDAPRVDASAPPGLPSTIATSSTITLNTTSAFNIAATSTCAARIVTTNSQPIMLKFADNSGITLSTISGHLQLASTTVAYDSGQYGCGLMTGMVAGVGSTNITVSESR